MPTKEDEHILETNADIEFIWLYNKHPESGSEQVETVRKVQIPEMDRFGYVACEFSAVKEIRNYLRKELGWTSDELYAYSYWKSGVAEDKSVKDRQAERKSME